jgi:hypothetical protein
MLPAGVIEFWFPGMIDRPVGTQVIEIFEITNR